MNANLTSVVHGSNASVARPLGFTTVIWIGTVVPTNMAEGDLYFDISEA